MPFSANRAAFAFGLGAVLVAVGWIAGSIPIQNPSALLWIFLTLVLALVAIAIAIALERDPLSPLVIIGLVVIVLYVFRPLYILGSGRWGPTTAAADEPVDPSVISSMAHASRLVCLAIGLLVVGYLAERRRQPLRRGEWRAVRERVRAFPQGKYRVEAAAAVMLLAFALALFADVSIIQESGGLSSYLADLSVRSGFFFGRSYLTTVVLPMKVSVLLLVAFLFLRRRITVGPRLGMFTLLAVVVLGDFLTGGRAAILTGTLLPVVVLFHYLRRPVRGPALVGLLIVALSIFVVVRVVTRDAVYASQSGGNEGTLALIEDAVEHLPQTTVGGQEAIPYDSLLVLVQASAHGAPLQWGKTYLPIFTYPIPRAVWSGKPAGGGDVWFTQTYFPTFYGTEKIETSISFIGESFANFGLIGVALLTLLLGVGLSAMYRWFVRNGNAVTAVAYAVTLGYIIDLLRGDAFHSVTSVVLTLALLFVTSAVSVRRTAAGLARKRRNASRYSTTPATQERPLSLYDERSVDGVIVTYNSMKDLPGLLDCAPLRAAFRRLVVVDNGSTDDSVATARSAGLDVFVLPDNPGFGAAANYGIAHTTSAVVCVLNPDIRFFNADTLGLLAERFQASDTAIVGPRLILPSGATQDSARRVPTPYNLFMRRALNRDLGALRSTYPSPVPWVVGACFLVRRSAFQAVGGFDGRFSMYFEDVDLCVRLRDSGWKVIFDPTVSVSHFHRAASRGSILSPLARRHLRSALRFYKLHPRYIWRY